MVVENQHNPKASLQSVLVSPFVQRIWTQKDKNLRQREKPSTMFRKLSGVITLFTLLLLVNSLLATSKTVTAAISDANVKATTLSEVQISKSTAHRLRRGRRKDYTVHQCRQCRRKTPGKAPSFIIAGVHKGGTTSLFGNFAKHSDVVMSCCKETNFFSDDRLYKKGLDFYLSHFHTSKAADSGIMTGEGTPNYIRDPKVPARIKQVLPDVKVIISLRNPVERFVSHFVGLVVSD